jgi:glycosyltransferase involved in cell wall biosynthesis
VRSIARYYREDVWSWRPALAELIREFQPDVIHANNSVTVNLAVAQAADKRRIPSISHQKGFEHPGRLTRWIIKRSRFTHHIATSRAVARHLISLGAPASRCTTIYEPVIGPVEVVGERSENHCVPLFAMHSVLGHWKGQHIFLRAVAEVLRRGRTNFAVEIAGASPAGETAYVDSLHELVSQLNLQSHVRFVGHQRDVYAFLSRVDVAVHAAVEPEPFGRVVAEAMLSGLPTIVTAEGGPAEYVEAGVTGLHVPCGDVAAMADAIELLASSPEMRARMGRSARAFAVNEFDPVRLALQVVEVYDRVLRQSQSPASHALAPSATL